MDRPFPVLVPSRYHSVDKTSSYANDQQDEVIPKVTALGWTKHLEREGGEYRHGNGV